MTTQEQHNERDALALELGPRAFTEVWPPRKRVPDPAGWNRIQELEQENRRLRAALASISERIDLPIPHDHTSEIRAILRTGEPWCNHDAVAVVNGLCECGVRVSKPRKRK